MNAYLKHLNFVVLLALSGVTLAERNGSGTYTLPAGNPVNTGTAISSSWANNTLSDIAAALSASIAKDGQTVPTANLPMGGFKHTGIADGTARNHYASAGQVQDGTLHGLVSVSGTNTITANLTPAITSYSAGMLAVLTPANNNTGVTTLAVNGLAALDVQKQDGDALASGDLVAGVPAIIVLDSGGDDWILLNPQSATLSNGVAMSDLARLSQLNTFTGSVQEVENVNPAILLDETDAAADERQWRLRPVGGLFALSSYTDAGVLGSNALAIDRNGTTIGSIAFSSTALTWNGSTLFTAANDGAGSGLDADLLDGISSSGFWRPDNDGSGSGLDADLFDGSNSTEFCFASGVNCQYQFVQAVKTGDTSRANTITLVDDPNLSVALSPGTWKVSVKIIASTESNLSSLTLRAGMQFTGSANRIGAGVTNSTGIGSTDGIGVQTLFVSSDGTAYADFNLENLATQSSVWSFDFPVVVTSSGNLVFRWAQGSSSAVAVIVYRGSYVHAVRLL